MSTGPCVCGIALQSFGHTEANGMKLDRTSKKRRTDIDDDCLKHDPFSRQEFSFTSGENGMKSAD
jgi:hypothetical protein